MSTLLQQKSLINFVVSHQTKCVCKQCQDFGGVEQLFNRYEGDYFTDLNLRRIWLWLLAKYKFNSCYLNDLDFINDPTAPKLSDISDCAQESMVFDLLNKKYYLLADILLDDNLTSYK